MYILSIHEDTNANVTLIKNNKILFSVAKERITRTKFDCGFPKETINKILSKENLTINDIDVFISANKLHLPARILGENFKYSDHDFFAKTQYVYLYLNAIFAKFNLFSIPITYFNKTITCLRASKKCNLIDHHTAHAYSSYITSGFNKCIAISIDNIGDGYSAKVFLCKNGKCNFLFGENSLASAGQFYGELAELVGIPGIKAGKLTGLAGFGNSEKTIKKLEKIFYSKNGRFYFNPPGKKAYKKIFKNFNKADIAAGAQKQLEKAIIDYVCYAVKKTGINKIVVAGGVFANVRVNQLLWEHPLIEDIFIHPAMTDQGISLGAAYAYISENIKLKPKKLDNVYFGFEYSDIEIEKILRKYNLKYHYLKNDIYKKTAELIHSGNIIARFSGRMEYGPRALGNRSILMRATENRSIELNKKLKRTVYMPFAPVTLSEYADKCYENIHYYNAKFMTMSFNTKKYMKQVSPMIVHKDNTARPQIITEKDNYEYYSILKNYYELSKIPSIVNTSFNKHGEPIVESPKDAVLSFLNSGIDCLSIGNFIVLKKEQNMHLK